MSQATVHGLREKELYIVKYDRATTTILIHSKGEDHDLARTAILTLPSDRGFAIESPIYKIAVSAKSRSLHTILCVARSWSSGILVYIILYVRTAILLGPRSGDLGDRRQNRGPRSLSKLRSSPDRGPLGATWYHPRCLAPQPPAPAPPDSPCRLART